ncbi:DNA-directed RNA polymerase subunit alpha [candidate division WOR-1 bacterium RIFOXYA12_FULL_43_27]|uniref:DNA-directed RNA polymerase subunit alpha n=1 Tax=candidate division WOR-1 bacterium RIFOXYC2_FULL_46_14 TaxID=1802587 RepID=A0A1F4U5M0_UNCSA|nr:MAG: DNA-directed RNA polymerase subunit alpha [candidate division WOR-1 bacterium RIFOXYA12_FULL_43_27]OGC20423.1 MAG: DNA-directed RNA polymerase subunit alpha [candidate division WOR-1 bacterium RIFOXYB2_FULL_46_45]OGC31840.1 MAG: DNA-directed RNA polymerase subunit alpha [candidate division WOR-1 bacterium RIFOXYA2_FULL_46_56]OGC40268.1 MAG: DNA-directed RNA polymerase subunit alpha [candidate division WOR-1 bacterium RIFOXYC2_FULL_46_14]
MIRLGEKPWVKYEEESANYGRFIVEPLERGYGSTLGNALRRVLLSSLNGAAVSSIKIEGISHEFSTIPGVVEDVLQLILNIKRLVIKSYSDTPKIITLSSKKKGVLTAGDIEHDAEIEIINKDQVIATLDSGGKLELEMIVERGKGYVTSEANKKPNLSVGTIPIDSVFTPVLKVNLVTEEIRVGQEINYDRLILHVWTNGAIKPEEAVKESAKILASHINMFIHIGEPAEVFAGSNETRSETDSAVLDMNLDDLELSARSLNCLKKANVSTIGELMGYSAAEMMKFKNFGLKSLKEVREKLSEYKLSLKGEGKEK